MTRFALSCSLLLGVLTGCRSTVTHDLQYCDRYSDAACALAYLVPYVQQHPGDAQAQFDLGRYALEAGNPEKALAAFEAAQSITPAHNQDIAALKRRYSRALLHEAKKALDRQDYDGALVPAQQARRLDPAQTVGLRLIGQAQAALAHYPEARAALEQYCDAAPDDAAATAELGMVALHLGDAAAAEQAFQGALRQDPAHLTAAQGLVVTYLTTRRPSHAADLLKRHTRVTAALETQARQGDDPEAWRLVGEVYFALENYPEMAAAYEQLVAHGAGDEKDRQRLQYARSRLAPAQTAPPLSSPRANR